MQFTTRAYFLGLRDYTAWARKTLHAALAARYADDPYLQTQLSHIVHAENRWYGRIINVDVRQELWERLPLDELNARADRNDAQWRRWLEELPDAQLLAGALTYKNAEGVQFRSSYLDVLTQLSHHAVHHRAQAAAHARRAYAIDLPPIDYIFYTRRNA